MKREIIPGRFILLILAAFLAIMVLPIVLASLSGQLDLPVEQSYAPDPQGGLEHRLRPSPGGRTSGPGDDGGGRDGPPGWTPRGGGGDPPAPVPEPGRRTGGGDQGGLPIPSRG